MLLRSHNLRTACPVSTSFQPLLWFKLVTFQSQCSLSNLQTTNSPVWPSLWATGPMDKYRYYKPWCSVCKSIDCNNMRQLLVDRESWTAACRKHFLNLTLIWFWQYRELFVWGNPARHTCVIFISAQCCYKQRAEIEMQWCWSRLLCKNTLIWSAYITKWDCAQK